MGILSGLFKSKETNNWKELVQEGALLLDVRTVAEYAAGHIKGSLNIPLDSLRSQAGNLRAGNRAIITCCRSGNRSAMACSLLAGMGFTAFNGGAWNKLNEKIQ